MGYKKIIVTHVQSIKIQTILKADKGEEPLQELIDKITNEAEVEAWISEKFATAWRWNHRNDNEEPKEGNGKQQEKEELFYTSAPLPKKTNTTNDPANGTGKVAQIIALAEEGKSTAEIIALGYNKSTVYRQVSEWKKRKAEVKQQNKLKLVS